MSFLRRLFYQFLYLKRPPWDSGQTPPELLAFLRDRAAGRAIDLGCGTGTNVITLARLGWQVTGVDFVPRAVAQARKKIKQAGVRADVRVGDVARLDGIPGPFDLALDIGCFHSLSVQEKGEYLDRMERILAPGGFWFLYAFTSPGGEEATRSLNPVDLERITARFALRSRQDGTERGQRPSAYFVFQK